MRLRLGNNVVSREERPLGRTKYVLLNQSNLKLGGLVVQSRRWLIDAKESLLPASLCQIVSAQTGALQLNLTVRQFESLEPYWEYQNESQEDENYPTWLHCNPEAFFVYHPPHPYSESKRVRNCEAGLVQLGSSAQLLLSDGTRGRIKEFYFGPQSDLLCLTASFNNAKNNFVLPSSWLASVEDERLFLDMGRSELVERLRWPSILAASLEGVSQD